MIEGRSGRTGGESELRPEVTAGRRTGEEAIELASGLQRYRLAIRERAFDPPVRAVMVRRRGRRWVAVTRDLHPEARREALLEIVRVLAMDPELLF